MTIDNLIKGLKNIPPEEDKLDIMRNFYADMYMRNYESKKPEPILAAIDYRHKVDRMFRLYTHIQYKVKQ